MTAVEEACTEPVADIRGSLRWAAGATNATLALNDHQRDEFLEALHWHRLAGRFLCRLAVDQSAELSPELIRAVEKQHADARDGVLMRMELVKRLTADLRAAGADDRLVVLKGFTLYALTGLKEDLRWSDDLDLAAADPDAFVAVARACGFEVVGRLDHLAEYARLESAEFGRVELHSRFDVTRPPIAAAADLDPGSHPGGWDLGEHFSVQHVSAADMLQATSIPVHSSGSLYVLRPELAALISAAHMYKDSLRYLLPLPSATIRLHELASFVKLCSLDSFDHAVFGELVQRHAGSGAVAYCLRLAHDLLGQSPLPNFAPEHNVFPANLWWDGLDGGFPVALDWAPEELVYRSSGMAQLVEQLVPTDVPRTGRGITALSFMAGGMETSTDVRCIYRHDAGSRFVAECSVEVDDGGMHLRVMLPHVRSDANVGVALYLEDYRYEIFVNRGETGHRFADYSMRRDAKGSIQSDGELHADHGYVDLRLPRVVLDGVVHNGDFSAVLAIREQLVGWGRMTSGVVIPLKVEMPTA